MINPSTILRVRITSEVIFGLHGKESEPQADGCCDADGGHHPDGVMVDGHGADEDAEAKGEDTQDDDIGWVCPPDTLAADEGDVGCKEDDVGGQVHVEAI